MNNYKKYAMLIRMIVAIQDGNNAIGFDDKLLYRIREDLQRFKKLTLESKNMFMGRKTFETFPNPLPGRNHYVGTRDKELRIPQCITVNSIESAIRKAGAANIEIFDIIGGGEIYKYGLMFTDRVELTRIKGDKKANVFFPDLTKNGFYRTCKGKWKTDPKTKTKFRFERWERRKPTPKEKWNMFWGNYE